MTVTLFDLIEHKRQLCKEQTEEMARVSALPYKSPERKKAAKKVAQIVQEITQVKAAIRQAQEGQDGDRHKVTDHAVIRYLERAHGIDIDRLRDHILAKTLVPGKEEGRVDRGMLTYVFAKGRLITVLHSTNQIF